LADRLYNPSTILKMWLCVAMAVSMVTTPQNVMWNKTVNVENQLGLKVSFKCVEGKC